MLQRRTRDGQPNANRRHHLPSTLTPRIMPLALAGMLALLAMPSSHAATSLDTVLDFLNDYPFTNVTDHTGFLNTADGAIIRNNGRHDSGALTNGIIVESIENRGLIRNEAAKEPASALYNSNFIKTLLNSGTIEGHAVGLFNVTGATIWNAVNSKTIEGTSGAAILNLGKIDTLHNTQDGTILGHGSLGIGNRGRINRLKNDGMITASDTAIENNGTIGTISNTGTITAPNAILIGSDVRTTMTINNHGVIVGNISNHSRRGMTIDGAPRGTIGTLCSRPGTFDKLESTNADLYFDSGDLLINVDIANQNYNAVNRGASLRFDRPVAVSGNFTQLKGALAFGIDGTFDALIQGLLIVQGNTTLAPGTGIFLIGQNGFHFARGQRFTLITSVGEGNYNADKLEYAANTYDGEIRGTTVDKGSHKELVVELGSLEPIPVAENNSGETTNESFAPIDVSANSDSGANSGNNSDDQESIGSTENTETAETTASEANKRNEKNQGNKENKEHKTSKTSKVRYVFNTTPVNRASADNAHAAMEGLFSYAGRHKKLQHIRNAAVGAAAFSEETANQMGRQLNPSAIIAGAAHAGSAANTAVSNIAGARLSNMRIAAVGSDGAGDQGDGSGIATGEHRSDSALWTQVFGGRAGQRQHDNISGYHATYKGLLLGADTLASERWRAGALFSHARTNVNADDANSGSSAKVGSYGVAGYASYDGQPWFVNLMAGMTHQRNDTIRAITTGGLWEKVHGSFNSRLYSSSAQAGYPIRLGSSTVTPMAGLVYSTLRQGGYTESDDSGAALAVGASRSHSLKSDLGVKLDHRASLSAGTLTSSLLLRWRREFHDTRMSTTSSFAADTSGATSFTTVGSAAPRNSGAVTLGVELARKQNMTLSFNYTVEAASGYKANTADVKVHWRY